MKLIHISDLHIGKRVYEFPMLEDQKYILAQILEIVQKEKVDGVIIAGDIYDKPIPPAEAVQVVDDFLTRLAELGIMVFAISGNHDSAERLAFGARLMRGRGVYLSTVYDGQAQRICVQDDWGEVWIYLLPFVKPATVRHALEKNGECRGWQRSVDLNHVRKYRNVEPAMSHLLASANWKDAQDDSGEVQSTVQTNIEEDSSDSISSETATGTGQANAENETTQELKIETYQEALTAAVEYMQVDTSKRNILVAHQFVTGAARCESEEVQVGGLDQVDVKVFDGFDYVALGHLHSPQSVGRETVRYCGTPLKYSFSEAGQEKSVTLVELEEKGKTVIRTVPLIPLHDMKKIRGSYQEVMFREFYQDMNTEDYIQVTLTDEEDIPDGLQRLRTVYPNLMYLEYDNKRTRTSHHIEGAEETEKKTELELFEEFYELQNNQAMSGRQKAFAQQLIQDLLDKKQAL